MFQLITAALNALEAVMEKLPDFEQKKKNKYYDILKEYQTELTLPDRDDEKIDNLRDELARFLEVFRSELQK